MESNSMDEIDCTTFFEQIDDLIEFPPENEPGGVNLETSCDSKDVPSMWNGALPEKSDGGSAPPDLSAELFVPYEDIVQLEWLSTFVEESFCGGGEWTTHFRSPSPVSILDSSSSNHFSTQRARTKRPRPPATSNARAAIQISDLPPMKKGLKPTTDAHQRPQPAVRKCLHCDITKTPQWRAGPMGPKTLCNACGVRYKSGRLFPEYRPAASPTFLPCLHSNSHKKVMEMRRKITAKTTTTTGVPKLELVSDCWPYHG